MLGPKNVSQPLFGILKQKLLQEPIISNPDSAKPFVLTCDASDTAVRYVLGQTDDSGKEYMLQTPDQNKCNTTERDCLTVLTGI